MESDAGGGGERVLWSAVQALQNAFPGVNDVQIVIYAWDKLDVGGLQDRVSVMVLLFRK